jgi:hypothetical protein
MTLVFRSWFQNLRARMFESPALLYHSRETLEAAMSVAILLRLVEQIAHLGFHHMGRQIPSLEGNAILNIWHHTVVSGFLVMMNKLPRAISQRSQSFIRRGTMDDDGRTE